MNQAVQLQVDKCPFHYVDKNLSTFSLLTDHICPRSAIAISISIIHPHTYLTYAQNNYCVCVCVCVYTVLSR